VLGLDSNNVNAGPNVFPVGVRVCNTGSDPATNVVATWAWKTSQNSFTGPADGATVSVGTLTAGSCLDSYFEVTINRSPASRKKARDYQITLTADGGLSTAGAQRTLYIQPLVSQNRNHTEKLSGPNGCNLAYTICDPAPANILVGRTYSYKLYAETSTAYKQLETFANFPSAVVPVLQTSSTYSNPIGASSSSMYADACGWNAATRACVGPENIVGGKAGGRVVVTYLVKAIAPGSGTLRATIYDFSGASYHYNSDFDTVTLTTTPLTVRYELASATTGHGKVTSSPAGTLTGGTSSGIDCGGAGTTCSVGYGSGTVVTLTELALGADTFTGWSGGGCSGAASTCVVTMNQSRSVTAAFTGVTSYPLDVSKVGSGTVNADVGAVSCGATCVGNYASGTLVTLTATASTGWTFGGWSGEGCSGTGTCAVTMSQARSVTATFIEQTFQLSVTGLGNGVVTANVGTISCGNGETFCSDIYGSGTLVTLTATPASGQTLLSWAGACTGNAATCIVTMDQARSVIATFSGTASYTLDVGPTGTGTGTITSNVGGINCGATCSATYTAGTLVTLTAAATGGSFFNGWAGDCSGASTTCIVTMSQARGVTADFGPLMRVLTVTKAGSGAGTVTSDVAGINCGATCSGSFADGTVVTLTAAASAGSSFTGWSGDCSGTGTCIVTMSAARNVTATFVLLNTLTVTKTGSGAGTVTSDVGGINCGATCSADYTSGTVVLTAAASAGSRFGGWSGEGCSGTGTCTVVMSQARNVTADFVAVWTLTVSKTGSGAGTVSSDVGGISCGATCSADYDTGTSVTLSASASAGSRFGGWSGAGCSGTSTCTVVMSQARNVTANFVAVYTLTVSKTGSGAGTVTSDVGAISCGVTCSADYDTGTSVTLSASASAGSRFAGWSGAGCSGTGTCTVAMIQARNVSASFVAVYTLTVTKTGSGAGTVSSDVGAISCGVTCSADYDTGTSVTLSASASAGSRFAGWSGAGCSGTGSTCTVTMSQARNVTANFVAVYTLTVTKTGSGAGTVSSDVGAISCGVTCSADYDTGTSVTLSAAPAAGARFGGWSGEGCSGTSTCTVAMTQARTVTATFVALHTLTVTKTGSGGGTVSSDVGAIDCGATCADDYDEGTSVVLTATASAGSRFAGWSGAGCSGTDTCSVTMTQARVVTANFVALHTLTVSKAGSGAGTVSSDVGAIDCGATCSDDYDEGTSVILTAAAFSGSRFAGWSGAGCSGTDTCTVTMSQARNVTASFVTVYALTVNKTGSGAGTVSSDVGAIDCGATCTDDYDQGTSVTLSASASPGSRFDGWSGEGCSGTDTCTVTMSQARDVSAAFVAFHTLTVSKSGSGSGTVSSDVGAIDCGATCSDVYDEGTSVTLSAAASSGSRFAGWSGEGCSGTDTCTVTMSQARDITATFVALHTLTVTKIGSGSGIVSSDVGAIDCGATCSDDYDEDTSVTLSAAPAAASAFAGWSGEGCAGTGTCTVTMSQARDVTASFVIGLTLTVIKTGSGAGTVSSDVGGIDCGVTCSAIYDAGTSVTLSATPAAGSRFAGWSGAGCSGTDTCTVTMSQARNVTATFVALHTLTVTKTGSGSGTVTSDVGGIDCGSTCSAVYDEGTSVTLSASASAGSRFAGWSGEGCSGTDTCTVTVSQASEVGASFVEVYTLTVTKTGSGSGTVSSDVGAIDCGSTCTDDYDTGTSVTLSASAAAGSRFAGWSGAGCSGTDTCTVTMSQARNVTATFVAVYALTVSKTGSGAGTVSSDVGAIDCGSICADDYDTGTSVTLSASASAGSRFAGWSGEGCSGTGTCTVTMSQARNVAATFVARYTLTVTKTGSGSGTVTGAGISCGATCTDDYDNGTSVTLSAPAAAGSRFAGWSGAGCSGTGTCTVTMSQARNIGASFVARHTLTVTKTGSGLVSSDVGAISCGATCTDDYDEGTRVTLTASAPPGSRFAGWSGACSGTANTCTVTMSEARNANATFVVRHTLLVSRAGSRKGSVSSRPAGIHCGADCSADYDEGTTVTLTALPAAGSQFVGWSGEGCNGTGACTLTMSQSRAVTATFVSLVSLRVTVSGRGAVRSEPRGIRCGHSCTSEYESGTHVTLKAKAKHGRWFLGWSGACSGRKVKCTVTMSRARLVHARFARALALRLQIPNWLVYHWPHEQARIRARATWRGKRLAGAHVELVITCRGRRSTALLTTGHDGRVALSFRATMPNMLRVLTCKVRGRVTAKRRTARADKPGTLRFIHPLWLESHVTRGKIVVRVWGRAGEAVQLFADGNVVGRARIGRAGWVEIVSGRIQHGDNLWVTGPHGHTSHRVTA